MHVLIFREFFLYHIQFIVNLGQFTFDAVHCIKLLSMYQYIRNGFRISVKELLCFYSLSLYLGQ